MRYPVAAAAILALGLATFCTIKAGYADRLYHLDEPLQIARARRLMPGNAAYYLNDSRDLPALEHALARNPYCSSALVNLGLAYEMAGQAQKAERLLLEAARIDATYVPRWSLANLYFRSGDQEKFWVWARRAAEISFGDETPLFQLCWRMTQNPDVILSRAIPDRASVLSQYLFFLLSQDKLAEAERAGRRLVAHASPDIVPLLTSYCDRLITGGRIPAALTTWNALCRRGLLSYTALDPGSGRSLTNGDFAVQPRAAGFDWRLLNPQGIRSVQLKSPQALRFTFSGHQPESCPLISQVIPTEPSSSYRLAYNFRTSGAPNPSGLSWYVSDLATGKELAMAMIEPSEDWRQGEFHFTALPSSRGVNLVLQYRRAAGTTRIEGDLWLSRISLAFR